MAANDVIDQISPSSGQRSKMKMKMKIRGTGFRRTLPAVFPFFAIWFLVLVLTPPIIVWSMVTNGVLPPELQAQVWFALLMRMPIIVLAGVALAILTTARIAGPMIALGQAFEDVRDGNLDRRLTLRRIDRPYLVVEMAFNQMMVALKERADLQGDLRPR